MGRAGVTTDSAPSTTEPNAPRGRRWRGYVFLGMSVDGFIARSDGDLDWLTSRGETAGDAGYTPFMAQIDHLVVGRATYETVRAFGSWPYEGKQVLVLSRSLDDGADPRVRVLRSLDDAVAALDQAPAHHVYVDGGRTIASFLAAGLIDDLTLTRVPVLIGEGVTPFGALPHDADLLHLSTDVLPGGLVQSRYRVVR